MKRKDSVTEMNTRIGFKYKLFFIFSLTCCLPIYSQSDSSNDLSQQKIELSLAYGVNYIFFNDYFYQEFTSNLISAELNYRVNDHFLAGISYYYNNYDQVNEVRFGPDTVGGQVQYDYITDLNISYNWHRVFANVAYAFNWTDFRLILVFGLGPVFLSYEEKMTIEKAGYSFDYHVSSNVVGFGLLLKPKVSYLIQSYLSLDLSIIWALNQTGEMELVKYEGELSAYNRSIDLSSNPLSIIAGVTLYL